MNKPDIELFVPRKFKKLKSNGYRVEWDIPRGAGESNYADGFHMESENVPHPDLINLFTDINEPVKEIICAQPDANYYVNEINISGEDGKEAASFTGFVRLRNGQKSTFKTDFIKLREDTFGVEGKLWSILENLKTESFLYVFEDKFAQLRLFNDPENDTENDPDATGETPADNTSTD